MSASDTPSEPQAVTEKVDGRYEGFFSVVVCDYCEFDHHIEGDVSSGEEYVCEGCGRRMEVVNR